MQDPPLDDLYADFDLGFVLGFARASEQYGHAIVLNQVAVAGVDVGLVAMRLGDAASLVAATSQSPLLLHPASA